MTNSHVLNIIYIFSEINISKTEIVTPTTTETATLVDTKTKIEDKPPEKKKEVVDLTLSDSDDDEPLAKRRAVNPKPGK